LFLIDLDWATPSISHNLQLSWTQSANKMVLINISVYDSCCSKTLLSWTVLGADDGLTVSALYETVSF